MSSLGKIVAAHPLQKTPYNAIKFVRVGPHGTLLYRVSKDKKEMGAEKALKVAFEKFGGHCFHCEQWMEPQKLSQECGRDHLRPLCNGGLTYLHNLVFSCGECNRKKGGRDLITFSPDTGIEYMKALDEHLVRCLNTLGNEAPK